MILKRLGGEDIGSDELPILKQMLGGVGPAGKETIKALQGLHHEVAEDTIGSDQNIDLEQGLSGVDLGKVLC